MSQKISNVRKVIVVTEDGSEHTFEGVQGAAYVRSQNYVGLGIKNQPYTESLSVHLTMPPKENVQ